MAKQTIFFEQNFRAPLSTVFNELTDHNNFGRIIGMKIIRIKNCKKGNANGIGSVRRITPVLFSKWEETVITYIPNKIMEYTVIKGSPVKNHKGTMEFSEKDGVTNLKYVMYFEPKIPFIGKLLKTAIEGPLVKRLKQFAETY